MTESQLHFRVGIFVVIALGVIAGLLFQFGELQKYLYPGYTIAIHFDSSPGVNASSPVRLNGIEIGSVRDVVFDEEKGGVLVLAEIRKEFHLQQDARPRVVRSLFGDAAIEFSSGSSKQRLEGGTRIEGIPPTDPMQIVHRLERNMTTTLDAFHSTSEEWRKVGQNINSLMETNGGRFDVVMERTVVALSEFTKTMQTAGKALGQANEILGDPEHRANLRRTMAALPKLVEETSETIAMIRSAVEKMDKNLANLNQVTEPLAKRSPAIVAKLDNTLSNMESLTEELNRFAKLMQSRDGSLHKLMSDPELYRNLNRSAESLAILLKNTEPIVRDMRIFSDKIARHPELLGVSGAMKGSSGLKDPTENRPYRQSLLPKRRSR